MSFYSSVIKDGEVFFLHLSPLLLLTDLVKFYTNLLYYTAVSLERRSQTKKQQPVNAKQKRHSSEYLFNKKRLRKKNSERWYCYKIYKSKA